MHKKYIAFNSRFLPINNHVVLGAGYRKSGGKNIISEITQSMGGMLIGDSNVMKGKGVVRGPERRRPIKFII